MTTDTPRTDACPHCGAGIYALLGLGNEITYWQCGSNPVAKWEVSRSPECYEKELSASKAEVERLKLERDHAIDMELAACAREEMQKAEVERLRAIGNLIADNAPLDFKLLLLEKFGHQLKATLNPNK